MNRIFVLGYLGSATYDLAHEIASERNIESLNSGGSDKIWSVFSIDDEIVRLDGRSLIRICMGHGEHEYRNREYEILSKLINPDFKIGIAADEIYPDNLVVVCGDGIVLDEQCYELLKLESVKVSEQSIDEMWERAKTNEKIPYAYMLMGTEEEKRKIFEDNYNRRKYLYDGLSEK